MVNKRKTIFFLSFLVLIASVSALSFIDNTETEFNAGTHNNTLYNATGGFLQLNITTSNGTFVSQIFNATANATLSNISWWAYLNYSINTLPVEDSFSYYSINEGSGVTLTDTSGNARHCILRNTEAGDWITGKDGSGYSIKLDGTDESADCGNVAGFERTDNFSIEGWINTTTNSDMIISKNNDITGWQLYILGGGNLFVSLDSNKGAGNRLTRVGSASINDGQWHHFAFTYDGSSNTSGVKIYVDGVEGSSAGTNALSGSIVGGTNLSIGSRAGTALYLDGTLDKISIWEKELTEQEIINLNNSKTGGEEAGEINLSVRSCVQADCSDKSFTDISGESPINLTGQIESGIYHQYKLFMRTTENELTPTIYNVSFGYDFVPTATDNAPSMSTSNSPTSPATYSMMGIHNFTAEVVDGETSVDVVYLAINNTGSMVNITPANDTLSIFYVNTSSLAVGTYNLTWYANDTDGNVQNSTELYIVTKHVHALDLKINNQDNDIVVPVGEEVLANGTSDHAHNFTLYINDSLVAYGTNPTYSNSSLEIGDYIFNLTSPDAENHSFTPETIVVKVRNSTTPTLTLNGVASDYTTLEGNDVIISYDSNEIGLEGNLYRNGVIISNGTQANITETLGAGTYVYNFSIIETDEFTATSISRTLRVTGTGDYQGSVALGLILGMCFLSGIFLLLTFLVEGGIEAGFFLFSFFCISGMVRLMASLAEVSGMPSTIVDILEAFYIALIVLTMTITFWIMLKFTMWLFEFMKSKGKGARDPIDDDIR